jgi:DNA-directed RNA polymerase II subunit RPB1
MEGLHPLSFIYHAAAGRLGVISTSIKTADTGYLQRKLMKVLEDSHICYDGTVRNASNIIVQYVYGGDGFDGARIERQSIDHMYFNDESFLFTYMWNDVELNELERYYKDAGLALDFDQVRSRVQAELDALSQDRSDIRERYEYAFPDYINSPINFQRIIKNVRFRTGEDALTSDPADILTPTYIIDQVEDLNDTLKITTNRSINAYCMLPFMAILRSNLSSKKLILKEHYNKHTFDLLIQEIKIKFLNALVTPGEGVGVIAAQRIGEPATQLTLDTFHHTGVGSKANVSRGVPRLKEIVSLTSKLKTPSVTIYLENITAKVDDQFMTLEEIDRKMKSELREPTDDSAKEYNAELKTRYQKDILRGVRKVRSEFEYIKFSDIVKKTEISYDPDNIMDTELMKEYWKTCEEEITMSPWVIRFFLDHDKLAYHGITMFDEIEYLLNTHKINGYKPITCFFNDFNSEEPVCRVSLLNNDFKDENPITVLQKIEASILNSRVKGIKGINRATTRMENKDIVLDNGMVVSRYSKEYKSESDKTVNSSHYVIDTLGTNLLEILNQANVNTRRTISNDIHEIFEIFGIEAARRAIFEEINEVMEYQGVSIDPRHINLLVDSMTSGGVLLSADRYGVRKGDTGPWARASFEETTPQIATAAVFCEDDNMQGVSANIMYGQFTKFGTNSFDVLLDEEMMAESGPSKRVEETGEVELSVKESRRECDLDQFSFNFSI